MEIHGAGSSSFWGNYPEFCEESGACQYVALSPVLSASDAGLKLGEEPKRFELQDVIQLDCADLDGKPFDWRHYGGPLALLGLSRFVRCNLLGDSKGQEEVPLPERVYYQQGDLILMKIDEIPADAVPVEVDRLPGGGIPLPGGHVIVPADKE